jgi:hypothetical protein
MVNSAMRGVPVTLQPTLSTTGDGVVIAIPSSFKNHTFIIKGSAGISAGAVQPEFSDGSDYAGTWAAFGNPLVAAASAEVSGQYIGVVQFVRARISTDIVGGTVEVIYIGS